MSLQWLAKVFSDELIDWWIWNILADSQNVPVKSVADRNVTITWFGQCEANSPQRSRKKCTFKPHILWTVSSKVAVICFEDLWVILSRSTILKLHMADSKSHQTLVNLLQDGLHGSEKMYRDIVDSKFVDDFFSEEKSEESLEAGTETVRIAAFDVGNYRPEEVEWKIEDGSIYIRGQKTKTTSTGATGSKFCRCVPIPDNINTKTVTARFCVGGGLYVVEGKKLRRHPPLKRNSSKTAFFGDSHFSLSVDLGDGVPINESLSYGVHDKPEGSRVQLF